MRRQDAKSAKDDPSNLSLRAAQTLCRRQDKDFYQACLFLPREKRSAACAIVSFCRMIEQAFITTTSQDEFDALPDLLSSRVEAIYESRVELPNPEFRDDSQHVLAAMMSTVKRFEIPRELFAEKADAARIDKTITRYPTYSSLEKYLDKSTGTVVAMLGCVFGLTHSGGRDFAIKLGRAIGLMRIIRDLKSDRDRGKIYLPLEDLARFKYSERDLGAGTINLSLADLSTFESNRANELFDQAAEGIRWLADDGSRLTAASAIVHGRTILSQIRRKDFDVFGGRFQLSMFDKLRLLPAIRRLARKS